MRILHTADWHLGRQFHNVSLLGDQSHVLDQFVDLVKDTRADAVVVAGDVYDRSVPPQDAVQLLDETLERIVIGCGVPMIMIAGNHDSPQRLGFGAKLVAAGGLHLFGPLASADNPVVLADDHGSVAFFPLPYADPTDARLYLQDDAVRSHDDLHEVLIARGHARIPRQARRVAVGHCWVVGGEESESERPLSVGGTGHVRIEHFAGFDYTALGHLHRPQTIGEKVRYAGSLLKYSFSEVPHQKSITLVEMDKGGGVRTEEFVLTHRRDVRVIDGELAALVGRPHDHGPVEDFLLVRLHDRHAILDPMGKLRQAFPNVLHIERPGLVGAREGGSGRASSEQLTRSPLELFASFYEDVTGDTLIDGGQEAITALLEEIRVDRKDER